MRSFKLWVILVRLLLHIVLVIVLFVVFVHLNHSFCVFFLKMVRLMGLEPTRH